MKTRKKVLAFVVAVMLCTTVLIVPVEAAVVVDGYSFDCVLSRTPNLATASIGGPSTLTVNVSGYATSELTVGSGQYRIPFSASKRGSASATATPHSQSAVLIYASADFTYNNPSLGTRNIGSLSA